MGEDDFLEADYEDRLISDLDIDADDDGSEGCPDHRLCSPDQPCECCSYDEDLLDDYEDDEKCGNPDCDLCQ